MPDPPSLPPRTAIVVVLLLLAAALLTAMPARASAAVYVALGDSYSSGLGAGEDEDRACHRTPQAFPVVVASRLPGSDLRTVACAGATIPDVTARQLGALSADTAVVTITIGGNDAGFAKVITRCALPAWAARCGPPVARAREVVRRRLPARLDQLYTEIRRRAPVARVVVAGYPRLFNGIDCGPVTFFSRGEQRLLDGTAEQLRDVLRSRAAAAGFAFADVIPAFRSHAICDRKEWLNGLSVPLRESFHPNGPGHAEGYAPAVLAAIARAQPPRP